MMDDLIDALNRYVIAAIYYDRGWYLNDFGPGPAVLEEKNKATDELEKALNNFVELKVREMLLPHLNALHKLPDGWSVDL